MVGGLPLVGAASDQEEVGEAGIDGIEFEDAGIFGLFLIAGGDGCGDHLTRGFRDGALRPAARVRTRALLLCRTGLGRDFCTCLGAVFFVVAVFVRLLCFAADLADWTFCWGLPFVLLR